VQRGKAISLKQPEAAERIFTASQWQLVRWRFARHKLAVVSMGLLAIAYFVAIFCEFMAPYSPQRFSSKYILAPPQRIRLIDETGLHLRPFVYGYTSHRDPKTLGIIHEIDKTKKQYIRFFVHGDEYKFWGIWRTGLHLFGTVDNEVPIFLLGADDKGRDMLSRVIYGSRVSLSVGLVGVSVSFVLGVLIGGISGYFGGLVDVAIQRIGEVIQSVPGIPLWMTLAAAVPRDWSGLQRYFAITIVLSVIGWVGLARTVRGKFLALREEEFILAAKLCGTSELVIIVKHLVPSFLSHLIAVITLSIPNMIFGETALSFLGLGLSEPTVSWGTVLQPAIRIAAVAKAPWTLLPAAAIIVTVLSFNFVGDGLRDAADPYG